MKCFLLLKSINFWASILMNTCVTVKCSGYLYLIRPMILWQLVRFGFEPSQDTPVASLGKKLYPHSVCFLHVGPRKQTWKWNDQSAFVPMEIIRSRILVWTWHKLYLTKMLPSAKNITNLLIYVKWTYCELQANEDKKNR